MAVTVSSVADVCRSARAASRALAVLDTATKDAALHAVARALQERTPEILEANARDLRPARGRAVAALMDRLALDEAASAAMAAGSRRSPRCRIPSAR
jgi:glutamate-5-semialdehyde dehydrogenase